MLNFFRTYLNLEQTSHWLPLINLFTFALIIGMMPKNTIYINGRQEKRWYRSMALLVALPYILWAGFRYNLGDTRTYIFNFNAAPSSLSMLNLILSDESKDPGFTILMTLLKQLGLVNYWEFFLVIAFVQMLCIVFIFQKYSSSYWISLFLFIASTDYMSWMHNGMRQFLAVCLIFAAFDLLVKKRYTLFGLVVVFASTMHGSALLMIPLAYIMQGQAFNRKTLMCIAGTVLILPFIDRLLPLMDSLLADTQYSDMMTNDIWANDDGTNPIRVLVYSVPAIIALFGRRYIQQADNPVMNMCANASVITMSLYIISAVTSGIYIGRLPIYTTLHGYILLPWLIDQIFEKSSVALVRLMMIGLYLLFFYYQMHFTWDFI